MQIVFVANTNCLTVNGLRDTLGVYLNAATVTLTIKDALGVAISGATWPVTLAYIPLSKGNYAANLPSAIGILNAKEYTAVIDATQAGVVGHWERPVRGRTRTQ